MNDKDRLIEHAFPLKQASLDSVHEKNVRHGHISTLHIWPARRPLAACRAALIATLLPDPGTPEERSKLIEKIGGKIIKKTEKKKMPNGEIVEREKEETEGGILHWGRDIENKEEMRWFREQVVNAYGGRIPKVLDPFAGGGAIPLEASRLGCDVTAIDINPVAWFILKCTLEYPNMFAGKTNYLPESILNDDEFMDSFYKAHPHFVGRTKKTNKQIMEEQQQPGLWDKPDSGRAPKADLAWHVRAWGEWVRKQSLIELARFYPIYAEFEHPKLSNSDVKNGIIQKPFEKLPIKLVPVKDNGNPNIENLNKEFSGKYLEDKRNPRWIAKPTVAYLWARTVKCKNCRAIIPLLKTRWLCKKKNGSKRVMLTMEPNLDKSGVIFGIQNNVPLKGGNTAQRRENDKRIGAGTMSKSGAKCPCCGLQSMTMEDIRLEALSDKTEYQQTAVVVEGQFGKEYRIATETEIKIAYESFHLVNGFIDQLPNVSVMDIFEPCSTRSISAQLYGVKKWSDLYTPRQLIAISTFGKSIHKAYSEMQKIVSDNSWNKAVIDYLCLGLDRLLSFLCVNACWKPDADSLNWAFSRFSISLLWDFAEAQPLGTSAGSYIRCNERIATALDTLLASIDGGKTPNVLNISATDLIFNEKFDLVITDPPYYQAVSYADLSDFSYTWLRGFVPELPSEFTERLSNKTKEVVQHIREDKSRETEKIKYENLMSDAFNKIRENLTDEGRFICVFAHKEPDAWETLVSAIIRAGFVVTGSWPIQDNLPSRQRASSSAALASSVWIVCKPRSLATRPGWDNQVIEDMRKNIKEMLREFWDAGIRGPDFVWAATGPALEAYSKHPLVKKANEPGPMTVSEFLTHVRRLVVEFVVGRVLSGDNVNEIELAAADRLDETTAYYLLHRHDFGMEEAPAGACILYAISCGVSDKELADTWDIISYSRGQSADEDEQDDSTSEVDNVTESEDESGSKIKLKTWAQRNNKSIGFEAPDGKPIPLIDRVHRLMHLWKGGDLMKVDEYIDSNSLRRQELFKRLLQSLIELSPTGSEERSLLESISNHIGARGALQDQGPVLF